MPISGHLDQDTIVNLASGGIDESGRDSAFDHLAACAVCRERFVLASKPDLTVDNSPKFPELSFFESRPREPIRRLKCAISHDPAWGETYHLPSILTPFGLVIGITSPRDGVAEFIADSGSGWSSVAPRVQIRGSSSAKANRCRPIQGLSSGSVIGVVITERPVDDLIHTANCAGGGSPPPIGEWIAHLSSALSSRHDWLEIPIVRLDG